MTEQGLDSESILATALEIAAIAAPPFAESVRGDEVERRMRAVPGWQVRRDAIGNVIALLGDSYEDAVWAIAHLDTVFAAEQPLNFERVNGVMRGPGIGDNSLGIAALLTLAPGFAENAARLQRPLVFAFSVGEEGLGDLRGVRAMLESGEPRSASAVIAVEGHRGDALAARAVGSLRYRGSVHGPGGHSWGDRGRPSALHNLVDFARLVIETQAKIGGDLSVNIGTIHGGTYVTAIAADAEVTFEARSTSEDALRSFEDLVKFAAGKTELPVGIEEIGRRPAGELEPEHPLILATQAAREREGLQPARLVASSTDANAFVAAGIPALSVGLTTGRNQHHPSEEIDVEPIGDGVRALRRLLQDLTKK